MEFGHACACVKSYSVTNHIFHRVIYVHAEYAINECCTTALKLNVFCMEYSHVAVTVVSGFEFNSLISHKLWLAFIFVRIILRWHDNNVMYSVYVRTLRYVMGISFVRRQNAL